MLSVSFVKFLDINILSRLVIVFGRLTMLHVDYKFKARAKKNVPYFMPTTDPHKQFSKNITAVFWD